MDGLTALFGVKVAGMKLLFPYIGVEKYQNEYSSESVAKEFLYPILIVFSFIGTSLIFNSKAKQTKKANLKEWKEEELPKLWAKHLSTL